MMLHSYTCVAGSLQEVSHVNFSNYFDQERRTDQELGGGRVAWGSGSKGSVGWRAADGGIMGPHIFLVSNQPFDESDKKIFSRM